MVTGLGSLDAMASAPTLHRLSPELYDKIVDAGLLDGEPVELVDGLLRHVSPQGPRHAALVQWLTARFSVRADLLRVQLPLAAPSGRPEPDVALVGTTTSREHPRSAALAIEVAVTSFEEDLTKLADYAEAGVPVVWLINVPARQVHVFEEPAGRRYGTERLLTDGQLPVPADGIGPVEVSELFAVLDR